MGAGARAAFGARERRGAVIRTTRYGTVTHTHIHHTHYIQTHYVRITFAHIYTNLTYALHVHTTLHADILSITGACITRVDNLGYLVGVRFSI